MTWRFSVPAAVVALALALAALPLPTAAAPPPAGSWPRDVTRICAGALLFEQAHEIGTRAGALAVAEDIRASTARRLARIGRLHSRPRQPVRAARWLALERRLSDLYARTYVKIYDVIAAARTPGQRRHEPRLLEQLVHAPDALSGNAETLEAELRVPDCTGGTPPDRAEPSLTVVTSARR